jgi:hypothetical protein
VTLYRWLLMLKITSVSARSTTRFLLPNFTVSIQPDSWAGLAITRRESGRSVRRDAQPFTTLLLLWQAIPSGA